MSSSFDVCMMFSWVALFTLITLFSVIKISKQPLQTLSRSGWTRLSKHGGSVAAAFVDPFLRANEWLPFVSVNNALCVYIFSLCFREGRVCALVRTERCDNTQGGV